MENKYLTVAAVNKYIKYRFDNDASLKIYLLKLKFLMSGNQKDFYISF